MKPQGSHRDATAPLLTRPPDSTIVHLPGGPVTVRDFLGAVQSVAASLPEGRHAINLVRDRYRFLVTFCAVLCRGQCNVLPPNAKPEMQVAMTERHESSYLLHDGAPLAAGLPAVAWNRPEPFGSGAEAPAITRAQCAMIGYTSGSTGDSTPIPKTWNMLYEGALVNARHLHSGPASLLATVPPQHMYGLELSVLLPLVAEISISAERPFFPADIARALSRMPAPRLLVTTPTHLRALVSSDTRYPRVERVFSATAPLDALLAEAARERLGGPVMDVYGCTEVGCIAGRDPITDPDWRPFDDFEFSRQPDGRTIVDARHLDRSVALQDRLDFDSRGTFKLAGRQDDMVKIGGKRGSLAELTQLLLTVPGVEDGQVFVPEAGASDPRLAAVYCGEVGAEDIRGYLRRRLDDLLLPRHLVRVDRLPRTETGKLPREALLALYDRRRRCG